MNQVNERIVPTSESEPAPEQTPVAVEPPLELHVERANGKVYIELSRAVSCFDLLPGAARYLAEMIRKASYDVPKETPRRLKKNR